MAKMYSWSTFPRSDKHPSEWVKHGDEVTADDFDDEAAFDELVKIGAVRATPYPIPRNDDGDMSFDGSPREYALAQIEKLDQDQYDAVVVDSFSPGPLQERAKKAMDEADWHPEHPDPEAVAEAESAEKSHETRQALEAQAGKGSGPSGIGPKRTTKQ